MIRVAARTARQRLRIAGQPLAQSGGEGGEEPVVALAEIDPFQNRGFALVALGGFGDLEKEGVAADFERGGIEALRLRLAPVPDCMQGAEARATQAFAP